MLRIRFLSRNVPLLLILLAEIIDGKALQRRSTTDEPKENFEVRSGYWDNWTPWSTCSRTCGGGVSRRVRECIPEDEDASVVESKRSTEVSDRPVECIGEGVQYRSCNFKKCPNSTDFRAEQCLFFNDVVKSNASTPFDWIPYYNPTLNPCHLYCHDLNHDTYTNFGPVYDGTRCYEDPFAPGVCADGTCLETGCDGVIVQPGAKPKVYDVCSVCDGDGQSCKTIKVEMSMDRSNVPISDYVLYQLPEGARNVKIVQKTKKPVAVFLGLKSANSDVYYINWLDSKENDSKPHIYLNESKSVHVPSTIFNYTSIRDENQKGKDILTTRGVITASLNVTVLVLGQRMKYNICITYTLPGNPRDSETIVDKREPIPDHNFGAFGTNSKWFEFVETQKKVQKQRMDFDEPPSGDDDDQSDNNNPEEAMWRRGGFRKCSATCGGGTKVARYECFMNNQEVDKSVCAHLPRPPHKEKKCNTHPCAPEWVKGEWSDPQNACGKRIVGCYQRVSGLRERVEPYMCLGRMPKTKEPCDCRNKTGKWVVKSCRNCSNPCGRGISRCEVVCEGSCPCDPREKERAAKKPCHGSYGCTHLAWYYEYIYPKKCGEGKRRSIVKCYGTREGRQHALPESMCNATSKPVAVVEDWSGEKCVGEWLIGRWGQCVCTNGTYPVRKRLVLCMEGILVVDPNSCPGSKPASEEACSDQPQCPRCEDRKEINCSILCHLGLCKSSYYRSKCCDTCKNNCASHSYFN